MARRQRVSGSLVASKIVPLMTLHGWRQAEHCQYSLPSRLNELFTPEAHAGQAKPAGQRDSISAASHLSSLPYRSINSIIDKPRLKLHSVHRHGSSPVVVSSLSARTAAPVKIVVA